MLTNPDCVFFFFFLSERSKTFKTVNGIVHHRLLNLKLFQTCRSFFLVCDIKEDIAFVFNGRKKFIQVCKNLRVNYWPFKYIKTDVKD